MARRSGEFSVCDTLFYIMAVFYATAFPIFAEILIVRDLLEMDWFDPRAWRYACCLVFLIAIQLLHLLYILIINKQKRLDAERRTAERRETERREDLIGQINYLMPSMYTKLNGISDNLRTQENALCAQLTTFCDQDTKAELLNLRDQIIDTGAGINILEEGIVEFRRLSETFDSRRLSEIFNALENFNSEIDQSQL